MGAASVDPTPVITRGHNVAVFVPPVPGAALAYVQQIVRRTLVLTADADRAAVFGDEGLAVSGLERAARRLAAGAAQRVFAGASDALALLRRSALKPADFGAIVIAWPEQLDEEGTEALEVIMAEADKEAQRIILTAEPGPELETLIERYAFKAMPFGFPPAEPPALWAPPAPIGPARYVIARPGQFPEVQRRVLDAVNPDHDEDLVVAPCPASRAEAGAAAGRTGGGQPPVFVIEAHQLRWLRSLFSPLSPLPLPTALDVLEQRSEAVRARLARVAEREDLDRELFLIGPLLERFDPALLAAAALRLAGGIGQPARVQVATAPEAAARAEIPSYAKIWVGVGRKDGAKPGDLVAVLAKEAKVPADAIGKIEMRDLFCLVDVRPEHAPLAVRGLTGIVLRGRRLVARVDRGPGPGPGPGRPPRRS